MTKFYKCLICGLEFEKFKNHFFYAHNIQIYEYLKRYCEYDIVKEYQLGKSANEISDEINEMDIGIKPSKHSILIFLTKEGIERRNNSEAKKNYYKKHKVWNKGLTKKDHSSINAYAESRKGKNNPIFKTSKETYERITNWPKYKTKEEFDKICEKISHTSKENYRNGKKIHWMTKLSDKERKIYHKKLMEGYCDWLKRDCLHPTPYSKQEKLLGDFLEERQIKYIKQFVIMLENKKRWFKYDYMLPNHNIIFEYNGSYWHCDPRKYKKDYYNDKKKSYAWELWLRDEEKKNIAEQNGFKFIVIWEEDVQHLTKEEYKGFFYEILENCIN